MKQQLFLLFSFLIIASSNSFAQEGTKAKKENFSWQKTYMDEAGIAADVQAKIEIIKEESATKIKAIKKDDALNDDAQKAKIKEIHKKKGDDIMALLSKEQKAKVKEIKERVKKENGENE